MPSVEQLGGKRSACGAIERTTLRLAPGAQVGDPDLDALCHHAGSGKVPEPILKHLQPLVVRRLKGLPAASKACQRARRPYANMRMRLVAFRSKHSG
jgi:hypothetical protein